MHQWENRGALRSSVISYRASIAQAAFEREALGVVFQLLMHSSSTPEVVKGGVFPSLGRRMDSLQRHEQYVGRSPRSQFEWGTEEERGRPPQTGSTLRQFGG